MKNLLFAVRPLALDFVSVLIFMGVTALTHNPFLATALAVAAGLARTAQLMIRRDRISAMHWLNLGLVGASAGATFIAHDARFMMFKPTLIYLLVAWAMTQRGWMLPYVPPVARARISEVSLVRWGYAWAGLMFGCAALNAVLAVRGDFAAWSLGMTAAPLVSKLVLFAVQYLFMRREAIRARPHPEMAGQAQAQA